MLQTGSNIDSIPGVIKAIEELKPKSLIDIGAGHGKYALLCAEYVRGLELIDIVEPKFDIETNVYNTLYQDKIQDFEFEREYDVALLTAVMGKFKKKEGLEILHKIMMNCEHTVFTIEKISHGTDTQWYPIDFKDFNLTGKELPHEWLLWL